MGRKRCAEAGNLAEHRVGQTGDASEPDGMHLGDGSIDDGVGRAGPVGAEELVGGHTEDGAGEGRDAGEPLRHPGLEGLVDGGEPGNGSVDELGGESAVAAFEVRGGELVAEGDGAEGTFVDHAGDDAGGEAARRLGRGSGGRCGVQERGSG